jgi:hypothetical protein
MNIPWFLAKTFFLYHHPAKWHNISWFSIILFTHGAEMPLPLPLGL